MPITQLHRVGLAATFALLLAACDQHRHSASVWSPNVFQSAAAFANRCDSLNQRFFLRSVFQRHYYWYEDIVDADPASFSSIDAQFNYLVTDATSPTGSGKDKDAYSTYLGSSDFGNIISGDAETSYGLRLTSSEPDLEGNIYVGDVVTGSVAQQAGIVRGDEITAVDGFSLAGPEREQALDGLFPDRPGESHTLTLNGTLDRLLVAESINFDPVEFAQIIPGSNVGYVLFNEHTLDAEPELFEAFQTFAAHNAGAGVEELILDLRYNSGGLLFVANQISYMIAGSAATDGKLFEQLQFNNRFTPRELAFIKRGLNPATGRDEALPELTLPRVFIIAGHTTCSASESILNSLRGIGVEVVLIGERSCGKPFGFIGFDNCGTTFLPVEFQSFNQLGQSNYTDGFRPATGSSGFGEVVTGCTVADDFTRALGDPQEARVAAALDYIDSGACPPTPLLSVASNSSVDSSALYSDTQPSDAQTGAASSRKTTGKSNAQRLRATRGLRVLSQ